MSILAAPAGIGCSSSRRARFNASPIVAEAFCRPHLAQGTQGLQQPTLSLKKFGFRRKEFGFCGVRSVLKSLLRLGIIVMLAVLADYILNFLVLITVDRLSGSLSSATSTDGAALARAYLLNALIKQIGYLALGVVASWAFGSLGTAAVGTIIIAEYLVLPLIVRLRAGTVTLTVGQWHALITYAIAVLAGSFIYSFASAKWSNKERRTG